jgi:hypothetical protein
MSVKKGDIVQIVNDIYENTYYRVLKVHTKEADIQSIYTQKESRELLTELSPSNITREEIKELLYSWYQLHKE